MLQPMSHISESVGVSIPKRVLEALKQWENYGDRASGKYVSIPKRVLEALKLDPAIVSISSFVVSIPKRVLEALKLLPTH